MKTYYFWYIVSLIIELVISHIYDVYALLSVES